MTSRDLIQQRTTLSNGDTVWKDSPLVDAALHGKMVVLDGINRIHNSTLAILHRYLNFVARRFDEMFAACSDDSTRFNFQIGTRSGVTIARWQKTAQGRSLRRDKAGVQ